MPEEDKKEPTDNEKVLLDKIDALEKRIAEQDKRIDSMTEFNRKLLDRANVPPQKEDNSVSKDFQEYLEEE